MDLPEDYIIPEKITYEDVYAALDSIKFPTIYSRMNVRCEDAQPYKAMCLGVVDARCYGVLVSTHCLDRPRLTKLLTAFAQEHIPGFTYTSIQINKNYASALHCDKRNMGDSFIVGVGNYTDGALWVHGLDAIDCHNRWLSFDGNIPHCTLPFTGTRYSLIYFTNSKYEKLGINPHPSRICRGIKPEAIEYLKTETGIPLPPAGLTKREYDKNVEERMAEARTALDAWHSTSHIL